MGEGEEGKEEEGKFNLYVKAWRARQKVTWISGIMVQVEITRSGVCPLLLWLRSGCVKVTLDGGAWLKRNG